jgi:hypothetical protein
VYVKHKFLDLRRRTTASDTVRVDLNLVAWCGITFSDKKIVFLVNHP